MSELNVDSLIGPTHHFGGLAEDNRASQQHKHEPSKPREAALQGLYKMKLLSDMGLKQAVLPPQERPDIDTLRSLGFMGSDEQVITHAFKQAPKLASACYSASSAWAANAATVSPSADTEDGRVHFTPANLRSQFHRSIETPTTTCALMGLFSSPDAFVHHDPIPYFPDEGSANQIRFCRDYTNRGVRLLVVNRRQSIEAYHANVRLHRLKPDLVLFAEQHPEATAAFHNDLVAVGNQTLLLYHEKAWKNHEQLIDQIQNLIDIHPILVTNEALTLDECIATYLFNSQLITLPSNEMALIAPAACQTHTRAQAVIQQILEGNNPIAKIFYFNLKESMKNGGGPACLRLPVPLTDSELVSMNQAALMSDILYHTLVDWVNDHYREELKLEDLADPNLLNETRTALDELTDILDLGPMYPFQQG